MARDGFYTMKFTFDQPAVEVASPVGTVTSTFGAMEEGLRTYPHTGIDYACPIGTEIHAPVDGVVSAVRDYGDKNLGEAVFVKMRDGQQYVVGHLSEPKVEIGQTVKTGDLLGLSGNTGNSTGPHLHFGAFDTNGKAIDPGNIPWRAFEKDAEVMATLDPSKLTQEQIEALSGTHGGIGSVGSWVGDKAEAGARFILEPVGDALGGALHSFFLGVVHALPSLLVVGGLICFLLTIALARHKIYFAGVGMWGLSAIIRGVIVESGI